MIFLKNLKRHLYFLIALLVSIFFAYWGLQNSFFEQDEWHSFGNYNFLLSLRGLELLGNILISDFPFHFAPLSLIFKMNLYRIFELNAAPYFITSVFIHSLVSVSVYLLTLTLTKRKMAAFCGALFFALNSSHYQAITWIGTFEGVQFSVLFGTLSLLSYLIYLRREKIKFLLLSFALLLIALLFKETALTFLLTLGLMTFLQNRAKIVSVIAIALAFLVYLVVRFAYILFGIQAMPFSADLATKNDLFLIYAYNFFTSLVKIFAQLLLPNEFLVYISNITSSPFGIYPYLARGPWGIENGFRYDLLTLPLGSLVILLIWWVARKTKDRRSIFLGLAIILFTIFPLLALNRYLTFLDSRYLYPATLGLSLIVSFMIARVIVTKHKIIKWLGLIILLAVLSLHLFSLKETVNKLVSLGQMRRSMINFIISSYPSLPTKAIFYTASNASFYGAADDERIMPFQSGFGQLLLIIYNPGERFPTEFFRNDFLWNITDQGYKEFQGRGFGYFRDFDLMADTFKKQKLPLEAVISFDYDNNIGTLVDTTNQTRQRLIGFISGKEKIERGSWTTLVSENEKDAKFALDGDETTFWDSHRPITSPQNFLIDFNDFYTISKIQIISKSSQNQNRNGYQILVSQDKQNWQEVFYEKLYPAKDGLVNFYFAPQKARFLDIKQVGDHQYASWVINEIKVYQYREKR